MSQGEKNRRAERDGGRVDRRVRRSRRAIIEAFDRLIMDEPIDQISVSLIAREADVDRKTFYQHFGSIDGLLDAIAEDVVTTGISSLETKRAIEEAGGICLGITCVVDRTKPEAPSPIPILASALKLDLPNYAPEECPLCKEGKLPLVHLGSRKMSQQAKQTL